MLKNLTLFLLISLSITSCGGGSNNANTEAVAGTKSISFSWDIPTTRIDKTALALSEVNGFRVYLSTTSTSTDTNTKIITIPYDATASYTIKNLASGTYYIRISTYDFFGDESELSDPISKTI
ncbi:MAG: hypothetical protein ACC657_08265 [Thiohalomonadales bacterium]